MSITVKGIPQLQRRLKAVSKTTGRSALSEIRLQATANAQRNVHRRTGNLGRSIHPGALTDTYTIVEARANYAGHEEFGTRPHVIRPRRGSVLAWPAAGSARLSGSVRRGGSRIYARKVNHPGTKAHPFLVPGAKKAVSDVIGADVVVRAWNAAA